MLRIKIINERQRKQVTHQGGELWLGRRPSHEHAQILIQDPLVSRLHLRVEEVSLREVAVENLGRHVAQLASGETLVPGDTMTLTLPLRLTIGRTEVDMASLDPTRTGQRCEPQPRDSADSATRDAGERLTGSEVVAGRTVSLAELGDSPTSETLTQWFETLLAVHRSAAGSDAFYDETASAVVELVGLDRGLVLVLSGDEWLPKAYCTTRGDEESSFSSSVLNRVLTQKCTFYDLPAAKLVTTSLQDIEAVVASPIFDQQNNVVGVVYGSRDVSFRGGVIRPWEAQFVQLLASTVGTGLLRLEQQRQLLKYENELAIGRRIQTSFLPLAIPHPEGWEIAARFTPAREVSGDFYDVFPLPHSGRLAIAIADVCDKGVGAALFMTLVRTLVRAFATTWFGGDRGPKVADEKTVVELAHQYVMANHAETSMFATIFFGVLDTATGDLTYVNGGHESPLVLGTGGVKQRLEPTGPAVGLFSDSRFVSGRVALEPGDTLFAYTDGITEARDVGGQFYGVQRLIDLVRHSGPSAAALLDRVEQSVAEHLAAADQTDDISMLAVRRLRT